ncbi:MAG: KpsF/GutQ family sugar-phosphate isomerase [Rhodospirillaceae bacterium]|nr:KpsF/GutQ family sugar-phosphate isomerase [Rhodospirillaceae bacterium]|tara:strand:- start:50704 stop:51690 length:987 start_codon:yes stop_codon:yes gene_type:complete
MTQEIQEKASITDLGVARNVLHDEAAGLTRLAEVLDESFVAALDIMSSATGRVIVSGMGKSGHIANKIAATLASTGTPAQYVNAGEASHGDLGMITKQDVLLALSNSGETLELSDMVAHTKINEIPLISITGCPGSSLDKAGDVSLVLPEIKEACPLNLAPTTSTTAMLALGDALAVALLERQGFSPENFSALHPGGQLGRRFVKVSDVMHRGDAVPLVSAETPMAEALIIMTNKSFGCVGITDAEGALSGIVTDGDLRRHMDKGLLNQSAGDVMTESPRTVGPNELAAAALKMMNKDERPVTALFVLEDNRPVGILHIHDLLRAGIV